MTKHTARNEDSPAYAALNSDDEVIQHALSILESRMKHSTSDTLSNPSMVKDFLRLRMSELEHEVFACLFLDAQHRLIAYEEMFRGILTQTSVYPREVVKVALAHNAAACIIAHNHPSGVAEPSQSDKLLTDALKGALALVDVRVLDHVIVGGMDTFSFADRGFL